MVNLGQEVNQSNSSQMVILDNTPPSIFALGEVRREMKKMDIGIQQIERYL